MSTIRTDKKFIFIHIPKTAGTSICSLIGGALHEDILFFKRELDFNMIPGLKFEDFFKFAFVRNPYDRLVSIYFYFFKKENNFKQFIKNNIDISLTKFKPQYTFICDENRKIIVDFIGRYENLEEDWKKISDKFYLEYKLPKLRQSNHSYYMDYYDEETRKIVYEAYKIDFELFKYEY